MSYKLVENTHSNSTNGRVSAFMSVSMLISYSLDFVG